MVTKKEDFRELSKTSPIFRGGSKEKSCFLRTLSQFMFTYWFKKWVIGVHRVVFHTHALWQKFIVHLFFFLHRKKMQVHHNFSKKGRFSFLDRKGKNWCFSASITGCQRFFLKWGFEFVFFNYWKHKTKFFLR